MQKHVGMYTKVPASVDSDGAELVADYVKLPFVDCGIPFTAEKSSLNLIGLWTNSNRPIEVSG